MGDALIVKREFSGSSESTTPLYNSIELNSEISDSSSGLTKFSLKGLAKNGIHNPAHGAVKNEYVPIQHTIGTFKLVRNDETVTSMEVELYGNEANSTYGFAEAKDEITELGFKRKWSKEFFLTTNHNPTTTTHPNNNINKIQTFTIPASAFGSELPKKTGVLCPLCSFASPVTEDFINSYTETVTNNYSTGYYIAMSYDETNDQYKVTMLTNYLTYTQVLATKLFIVYELENPVYDKHTNKFYVKDGDKFTFEQRSVKSYTTNKSTPTMATVPLTSSIQVPMNSAAVRDGFEQVSDNINDLNSRVDNIDVSNRSIGYADGTSDDSDNIQNLIDNAETTSGLMADIVIPEGTYALGKSLILNKSNIRIIGDGNVILKPTGNFPAIQVYRSSATSVEDITIENIKIYLPNTAYLDGSFEGSHSGIYINGSYDTMRGLYRINVKDVIIAGAYRYAWQNTDKSYGIYCKDNTLANTFAYFCNFENVEAYSVYCGIYLGLTCNGTRIHNYHWDRMNVHGYSGGDVITMGVAYGLLCKSSNNDIDFRGQSVGDDEGGWCYKDYDKVQYSLADVIGSANVKTVDNKDYFADDYTPNSRETITVNGVEKTVFLSRNNLSKIGIYCSGTFNNFKGHIYDPQRSDYQYLFTSSSEFNRYYYPTAFYLCGTTHTYSSFMCDLHGSGTESDIIQYEIDIIRDNGYENICVDYVEAQPETFVSDGYIKTVDENKSNIGHSIHNGIQDNALAYADKFSTIECYQLNGNTKTSVTIDNGNNVSAAIGSVFDPKSLNAGFRSGITFDQIPTFDNPIYIDINFNDGKIIKYLSRFNLQFNNYIARAFSIYVKTSTNSTFVTNGISNAEIYNNTRSSFSLLAYMKARDGSIKTWQNITGIRIIIYDALSEGTYNPDKKVGLSLIYAIDADHGGNAWLPRGGGDVYGDINMNDHKVQGQFVVKSSTENSDRKFKLTVDDDGYVSSSEVYSNGANSPLKQRLVTNIFTTSGVFVVPNARNQQFTVRIFGGGGGGFVSSPTASNYCGGGGGFMNNATLTLQEGKAISVQIGIGGQGGYLKENTSSSDPDRIMPTIGGTTSFGTYLSALGGGIAHGSYNSIGGCGGAGGGSSMYGGLANQFGGGGGSRSGGCGGNYGGGGGCSNNGYFGIGGLNINSNYIESGDYWYDQYYINNYISSNYVISKSVDCGNGGDRSRNAINGLNTINNSYVEYTGRGLAGSNGGNNNYCCGGGGIGGCGGNELCGGGGGYGANGGKYYGGGGGYGGHGGNYHGGGGAYGYGGDGGEYGGGPDGNAPSKASDGLYGGGGGGFSGKYANDRAGNGGNGICIIQYYI